MLGLRGAGLTPPYGEKEKTGRISIANAESKRMITANQTDRETELIRSPAYSRRSQKIGIRFLMECRPCRLSILAGVALSLHTTSERLDQCKSLGQRLKSRAFARGVFARLFSSCREVAISDLRTQRACTVRFRDRGLTANQRLAIILEETVLSFSDTDWLGGVRCGFYQRPETR